MSKYSILDINILYPLILEDIFLKLINKIKSCGKLIILNIKKQNK